MNAAVEAAKRFEVEIVSIPKSKAGADAKAPAVYLNDKPIAEVGFLKNGTVTLEELIDELRAAGVPELSDQ